MTRNRARHAARTDVVGDAAPAERDPEEPSALPAHREDAGEFRGEAVLAAGEGRPLHGEDEGELRERERDHREEERLDAEREGADQGGDDGRHEDPGEEAQGQVTVGHAAELPEGEGDGVGAEAEVHRVTEGDDPGVADHHVVARRERREERDLEGEVGDLEGRRQDRNQDERGDDAEPEPGRRLAEPACPRGLPGQPGPVSD